ncbi:hypothetical protein FOCC_FOCC006973 [Frankliniella occidentalis]|nr:hypothetical protein FOCC_FOCC006973 [Frankliniella occidentalis]
MVAKLGLCFLFLVAVCVVCPPSVQGAGGVDSKRCADNSRSCSSSDECCSGCCTLGTCNPPRSVASI